MKPMYIYNTQRRPFLSPMIPIIWNVFSQSSYYILFSLFEKQTGEKNVENSNHGPIKTSSKKGKKSPKEIRGDR
jgi:hypothetical protein